MNLTLSSIKEKLFETCACSTCFCLVVCINYFNENCYVVDSAISLFFSILRHKSGKKNSVGMVLSWAEISFAMRV
jgi:hypothetical protein